MFLILLVCLAHSSVEMAEADTNYRLPTTIVPQHYWVTLRPSFESEDFLTTGDVRILLNCAKNTSELQFNINDIDIDTPSVTLLDESDKHIPIIGQEWDKETQKYILRLGSELAAGQRYYLSMNFSYKLNENLEGFYRSSYKDSSGNTRWLATTQFSPINARRAFPCWDEPSFKAVFNITLGRHKSMTSLSNMQIFLTTPIKDREDWVWDHYESTLKMSTYLLAFIVTDLPSKDLINTSHPHFKVWSRPELLEEMNFMAELSPKVLSFIADYFGIPFPLEKIDLFSVPDFGFSAMENWGLITFAESALKTSKTIAHELAHQWFGNLVTPHWWEDLWLKEGFATFIGITALAGTDKSSEEVDKWIVSELQSSMFEDSLFSSHPVSNPVSDPRKIWQAFDAISYQKGSSIIRMMCDFLGEDRFRKGLNIYLQKFAFGNAHRVDLWESYKNISDIDVASVMDGWTLQTGYPVLSFTRDEATGSINILQERFLLNGTQEKNSLWKVPFSFTHKSKKAEKIEQFWLNSNEDVLRVKNLISDEWYLANLNQSGYYRVNYDSKNWNLLTEDFSNLPRLSQMQLINDAFNLAIPGRLDYSVPFKLVEKISDSTDKLLWNVTIKEIQNIESIVTGTKLSSEIKDYALSLFYSNNLTFNSKNLVLVKFASHLGQKNLVNESVKALEELMQGKNLSYSREVFSSIYCTGIKHSGQDVWEFIWQKYLEEQQPEDKKWLMEGLSCTRNQNNLKRLLDALMSDDSGIRKQEAKLVFSCVAQNEIGVDLALDFLSSNWKLIKQRYGLGYKIMSSMVLSLGPRLNQEAQLEKFQKLYADNIDDLGSTSNAFLNSLERIQINIKWLKEHYKTVHDYLLNKQ